MEAARHLVKWLLFYLVCRADEPRYLRLRCAVALRLAACGLYEGAQLRLLRRLVRPGDTAIDVGASFGVYSRELARLVGPGGRVLAFEPLGPVLCQAQEALRSQAQITWFEEALSDGTDDEITIRIPHLWGRVPEHALATVEPWPRRVQDARVRVGSLDRRCAGLERMAFLKLDVEGHETAVLRGGAAVLGRFRPVVQFECIDPAKLEAIWRMAQPLGYRLCVLGWGGALRPAPLSGRRGHPRAIVTYYLMPSGHPDVPAERPS